ncbi:uncharacterized protein K02A2.6-like [Dreissena polymorpha]|uniref:uncharacterized protein K02A2.6-like n=1 Tax=Dreissena polymorpha TaxID=45954 RepID=UPI0022653C1A|nr:uncharacterized protein K02A2.6-like [Dreissena polymorpha]
MSTSVMINSADIESLIKRFNGCAMLQKLPAHVQLHPWEWQNSSWERIHVDFAGPFLDRMFLVMVDAHSKWPEVIEMNTTNTERTIQVMRTVFARYGLPKQIVSDNGSTFTSESFQLFMKRNGILHIRTAVAKPSTNGLVERFNASFKSSICAMNSETDDLNQKLNCFLHTYRNTPHSTTGETPAKLFLGRDLRSRLDLLKPDTKQHVNDRQMKMSVPDKNKFRELDLGQSVLARDFRPNSKEKWIKGTIVSRDGPLMYKVDIGNTVWRRHIDQLRATDVQNASNENDTIPLSCEPLSVTDTPYHSYLMSYHPVLIENKDKNDNDSQNDPLVSNEQLTMQRRYPSRDRRQTA